MSTAQGRLFSEGLREPEPLCCLSFGGGQDSTAILIRLIEDAEFRAQWAPGRLIMVMSDTGDEHSQTLDHVGRMRELCERHGVEFYFLEAGGPYHSEAWSDLIGHYRRNNTIGSKAFPEACSANLKVAVTYRYCASAVAGWPARCFAPRLLICGLTSNTLLHGL